MKLRSFASFRILRLPKWAIPRRCASFEPLCHPPAAPTPVPGLERSPLSPRWSFRRRVPTRRRFSTSCSLIHSSSRDSADLRAPRSPESIMDCCWDDQFTGTTLRNNSSSPDRANDRIGRAFETIGIDVIRVNILERAALTQTVIRRGANRSQVPDAWTGAGISLLWKSRVISAALPCETRCSRTRFMTSASWSLALMSLPARASTT